MSQSLNKSILFHHRCRKKQEHSQSSKDFSMAISIPLFVVNIKKFGATPYHPSITPKVE